MDELPKLLLGKRTLALFALTVISFIAGAFAMVYYQSPQLLVYPTGMLDVLMVLMVFAAGFLFFGYLTPLPMLFTGAYAGRYIVNRSFTTLQAFTLSVSAFFVAYASILLGDALLKDMVGKGNFLKILTASLILLGIGIGVALVGDFLI